MYTFFHLGLKPISSIIAHTQTEFDFFERKDSLSLKKLKILAEIKFENSMLLAKLSTAFHLGRSSYYYYCYYS